MAIYEIVSGFILTEDDDTLYLSPGVAKNTSTGTDKDFDSSEFPKQEGTNYIYINDSGSLYNSSMYSYDCLVSAIIVTDGTVADSNVSAGTLNISYINELINYKLSSVVADVTGDIVDTRNESITENVQIQGNIITVSNIVDAVISMYIQDLGELDSESIDYIDGNRIYLDDSTLDGHFIELIYETIIEI